MSFEQDDYTQNEKPAAQQEGATEKELCRDFKKGDCRRGERCIYHHPKLEVCRDFQSRGCTRQGCRFVHVSCQEEDTYNNSGILPAHMNNGQTTVSNVSSGNDYGYNNGILGKRSYNMMSGASQVPMPYNQKNTSSTDVCRDFQKGDCRRGTRCKFYHPKLIICRDFQKEKCERENCRFLHMTKEEEETYEGNGIVPDHIDEAKLKKNRVMAPNGASGNDGVYDKQSNFQTGLSNTGMAAVLQENGALKLKLSEMQQQITDLRKMNDTLYEQVGQYRNRNSTVSAWQ